MLLYLLLFLSLPLACLSSQTPPVFATQQVQSTLISLPRPPRKAPEVWSVCYGILGCVNTTGEWYHKTFREENWVPLSRRGIDTRFLLHTKNRCDKDGDILPLTPMGLQVSEFDNNLPTFILIHDFHSSAYTGWIRKISDVLLNTGAGNVIAVNWAMGALPPYLQAVANTRVVALEVKFLLRLLAVDVSKVHIIGHGLGAHIAGYVGDGLPGLGRITGLDPSGPQFQGMPSMVRLDASDAIFVDVIHTDVPTNKNPNKDIAQGTAEISGHVDFYPNGGTCQPGCTSTCRTPLMKVTSDYVPVGTPIPGCSHKRSFKYFIESIENTNCSFMGFECPSKKHFDMGNCSECASHGSKCAILGLDTPLYSRRAVVGKYYVKTAEKSPYCLFGYRIKMVMDKNTKAKNKVEGDLTVSLVGSSGPPITLGMGTQKIFHGKEFKKVVWHGQPGVDITARAQVDWYSKRSSDCYGSLYVDKLLVTSTPLNPSIEEVTVALCSCDGHPFAVVPARGHHVFVPCSTVCTMLPEVQKQQQTPSRHTTKRNQQNFMPKHYKKSSTVKLANIQDAERSTFVCEITNGEMTCQTQHVLGATLSPGKSPLPPGMANDTWIPPLDDDYTLLRQPYNYSALHFG